MGEYAATERPSKAASQTHLVVVARSAGNFPTAIQFSQLDHYTENKARGPRRSFTYRKQKMATSYKRQLALTFRLERCFNILEDDEGRNRPSGNNLEAIHNARPRGLERPQLTLIKIKSPAGLFSVFEDMLLMIHLPCSCIDSIINGPIDHM